MLVSIDIETKCAVLGCPGHCEHALDPYKSDITCIGVYYEQDSIEHKQVYRDIKDLSLFLNSVIDLKLVGHNIKFDLKHLNSKGLDLRSYWEDDTQLMAATSVEKIPQEYLDWYERFRVIKNKELPRGYSHRKANKHSLKTLAPYFLKVDPFWENPANHDNDEYVLKDCQYTYKLHSFFTEALKRQDSYNFYKKRLLEWSKMLLNAELLGISIDLQELEKEQIKTEQEANDLRTLLDLKWDDAYKTYYNLQKEDLRLKYDQKLEAALSKSKSKEKCITRYSNLYKQAESKIPLKMNLDSPSQLSWILRDYLKLDISNIKGKEGTGKAVLQKLAGSGVKDLALYLEYRQKYKLHTAFFPKYKESNVNGIIHCNFNPTGTRTGRLSSNEPNLQQVPSGLRKLFVARPEKLLAVYDMSAIETVLISYYSEDPILLNIVLNGTDFHGYNAKIYFPEISCDASEIKEQYPEERKFSKTLGYALFYGAGPSRILETSRMFGYNWTMSKCKEAFDNFKETYRTVFEFKEDIDRQVVKAPIKNMFGRYQAFDDPSEIYMKNFNRLIQSSASDMVLESANRISKHPQIDVLLLVHDEIVCEIPETAQELGEHIKDCMTSYSLELSEPFKKMFKTDKIPLKVEGGIGKCWKK